MDGGCFSIAVGSASDTVTQLVSVSCDTTCVTSLSKPPLTSPETLRELNRSTDIIAMFRGYAGSPPPLATKNRFAKSPYWLRPLC